MFNKGSLLFLLSLISLAVGIFILQPLGQSRDEAAKAKPTLQRPTNKEIRKSFPIVQFGQFSSDEDKQKSEKYDNGLRMLPQDVDIPKDLEGAIALDWSKGLKALPVDKSDFVVVGKIVDAQAHLSPKKGSVYSEFKIKIENVLKNGGRQELENEKTLKAEREGGIVRYPSGNEFWHRVPGQRMPTVGGRYVLFLTHNFPIYGRQKRDLYLLTGYELKDGTAYPLDDPGDSHPLVSTYAGEAETKLLNDLNDTLKNQ